MCLRSVFLSLMFPLAALSFAPPFFQDTIKQHYEAAEAHKRAGNLAGAEAEFAAILAEGYGKLGKIYLAQQQYEKASEPLRRALARNPESAAARHMLGKTHFMRGEFDKAAAELEMALKLA